jgi:outer membrane protein TolC
MKPFFGIGILILCGFLAQGQDRILSFQHYLAQLVQHHPVVKQADLKLALSDAHLRLQQAIMDPYLSASYGDKSYDGKDYYTKSEIKVALPTAIGAEIFTGYNAQVGDYVNPEINTSTKGQYQAGISLPIGSDLLFNERMLAIKQARLMIDMAKSERDLLINDVLYKASLAYINWSLAHAFRMVQTEAVELSESQFTYVKSTYLAGDRPAIDTVEAFLQVQLRQYQLMEAERLERGARVLIGNFLWDEEGHAQRLAEFYQPQSLDQFDPFVAIVQDSLMNWSEALAADHPELQLKRLDIESLRFERQTALSGAMPQLNVKYALLAPGTSQIDMISFGLQERMLGVGISYPLLVRKQRSKLSLIDLKTQDKQWDLSNKSIGLQNQMDQGLVDYSIYSQEVVLFERLVFNYRRMLDAEKTRFSLGESSVFLVNSRENKLIEAKIKQVETKSKQITAILKLIQTSNRTAAFELVPPIE